MKKVLLIAAASVLFLSGCATVPLADQNSNLQAKTFPAPAQGKSGLYIYRDSFAGKALKKDIYLDGNCVGETSDKVYFYKQVEGDKLHKLSTESEFSPNNLEIYTSAGKNYYVRQLIKMGVFVGGAKLENVPEEEGKRVVMKSEVKLAKQGSCDD
ncbi:DUF2846 domain-containing protein [Pantoea vagans]|uniref:DUF2846 domain-containing protein n=1 Tax=Pantoea vagans TaxID=470934 RepID=UPI0009E32762|nr:DUF2846 domain-containing protein [Pantoea vagans]